MRLRLSGLRMRLILLVLLASLPAFGLAFYNAQQGFRESRGRAAQEVLYLAHHLAHQHQVLTDSTRQLLEALAAQPVVRPEAGEACSRLLAQMLSLHPAYVNLVLVDEHGDVRCSAVPAKEPMNLADRQWFSEALRTGDLTISDYLVGRITGHAMVVLAYPMVEADGRIIGVLAAALDLHWLAQEMEEIGLPPGAVATLVDRHGVILARVPDGEAWVGREAPRDSLPGHLLGTAREGVAEAMGVDGTRRLYGYAPLRTDGQPAGYVIVGLPREEVYGPVQKALRLNLSVLGGVMALTLLVAWVGGELLLLRRGRALERAARRLAQGDLGARTGVRYGADELSELARAFDEMAEKLEDAQRSYRLLFERMPAGLALLEVMRDEAGGPVDYRFLFVNPAFEHLTELGATDIVGRSVREIFPDIAPQWAEVFMRVAQTGEVAQFECQVPAHGKYYSVVVYRPTEGQVVTILTDIADRKRAEATIVEQLQILTALYAGAQQLAESLELETVARRIVRSCVEIFGVQLAWLGLAEEDGTVRVVDQYPPDHPYPAQIRVRWDETPEGQGPTGNAIRTGFPQVSAAFGADASTRLWAEIASGYGFQCSAALPLISRGHTIGALNVYSDVPAFFTPERVDMFQAFAHQAAAALENARLLREMEQRLQELEAISAVSRELRVVQSTDEAVLKLLRGARRAVGAEAGLVGLYSRRTGRLSVAAAEGFLAPNLGRALEVEGGIAGTVADTRQPYATEAYALEPGRWGELEGAEAIGPAAFVPLQSEDSLLGILMVARGCGAEVRPFSAAEMRLLVSLGEIGGNTLRRLELYTDAVRRLKHVQALRNIDMAITSSLDLRVTLHVLLDETISQLGVDAADVLLLNPHTQMLEFAAGRGFRTRAVESSRLRLGEGYAGRAALQRRIVRGEDSGETDDFVRARLLQEEQFVAYHAAPLVAKGRVLGVLEVFHRTPPALYEEWEELLEGLAEQAAIAVDNARLFSDLERSNIELRLAYDATIEGWSRALDLRDKETEGHTQRVTEMTVRLARELGMSEEEIVHLRRGALLHDIGKMGIPDHILLKPGRLTDEEWEIMRRHTTYAFEMLSPIAYLRPALDIPYAHHEKWDGTGYPRGLKGEAIPLAARIFAVVDVWDALTSDRPYRPAWSQEEALAYIREQAGRHFDPRVVEAFLRYLARDAEGSTP